MSVKSTTTTTPIPVERRLTRSNELARADLVRRLSGGAAWLAGYTVGGDSLDADTPNPAPRSPMHGRRGHTHAGGVDGRPLFRSIASLSLTDGSPYSGNVSQNGQTWIAGFDNDEEGATYTLPASPPTPSTQDFVLGPPCPVWVPGCDPIVGAYRNLAIRLQVYFIFSTNVVAGDELTLRVENGHPDGAGCSFVDAAVNATSGTTRRYTSTAIGTDTLLAAPGVWNPIRMSARFVTTSTVGSRIFNFRIISLELGVLLP